MSDNRAAIDQILSRTEEVSVGGVKITLSLPDEDVLREIRAMSVRASAGRDGDGVSEEALLLFNDMTVKVTAACVGCDEGTAVRLLAASGGERGELFGKVQILVGLVQPEDAPGAEELADPS